MTADEYIDSVLARLHAPPENIDLAVADISVTSGDALKELARRVAKSKDASLRADLQKNYGPLTLDGSGEVAIPADAYDLQTAILTLSNTPEPLEWVPDRTTLLNLPPMFDYLFFTLEGGKIKVRQWANGASAVPTETGLTITGAVFLPTLADIVLTSQLAEILFTIGVKLFGQSPPESAREAKEQTA